MNHKDYNTITVFKYFISFLEVWKQENYGQSAEINWQAVWGFVNASSVLDFNDELTDLVNSNPDEIEEKVHKWMEDRVLNDEPVYHLFKMSDWLYDKLEKEYQNNVERGERKRFCDNKCYHCKYWNDYPSIWVQEYGMLKEYHPGEGDEKLWQTHSITHHQSCLKWEELLEALKKNDKHLSRFDREFSYKPFNGDRLGKFYPNPLELNDCPYFEENGMTYDKYIKKYRELA